MDTRSLDTGDLAAFSEATKVEHLDPHTYRVNLLDSFCIGTVPNGGYVASCILAAAGLHLTKRGQKDVLNAHFQFLNRTETGPAVIIIEDIKLGRQLSTLHATLYQHALLPEAPWITQGSTRKEIAVYLTMTDLGKESGVSLPTAFTLQHPVAALPRPDFAALKEDRDAHWSRYEFPTASPLSYARCLRNCVYYDPRGGQPTKGVLDKWVRLASGENFTAASLGYVSDCWPYVVEAQRPTKEEAEEKQRLGEPIPFAPDTRFWYPTVVLNLEVKKPLPEEGLEWLQLRIQSKQIKDGRLDLEVLLLDEHGDLVALSNHVNLILGSERNTAERTRSGGAAKEPRSRI
ncbi:thioesterase-like superfamily-domain-containing protein [Chaetomidium leptoderma]|uniref:Thioesterase-like superfamily-domain-containing protein n=1 Tax=Chaetomidium leptoderma TaxID=669021 RepID=A0AAN6VNT7_9PEZI|nr:thioesterase-like superfamily-domain-containing protein [Chaetomidium leptoderma]